MLLVRLALCLVAGGPALVAQQDGPPAVRTTDLERLARPLVDGQEAHGLVLAWIARDGSTGSIALGRHGRADERALTADAVFEIGSLTKAFTGLVLTRFVARGELTLDAPLGSLLPDSISAPGADSLRLIDLATHTSGLAEIPSNLARDMSRFTVDYSGYGRADLLAFLAQLQPGARGQYLYSNAGFGILGWALAERAGLGFEELLRREVLEPLALASTAIALTPELAARLVPGHDPNGDPVPPMEFGALGGCGALRSDAADLLRFARAFLAAPGSDDELSRALLLASQVGFRLPSGVGITPGWNLALDGRTLLHDGQTAGFTSFLCFERTSGVAVAVLANQSTKRLSELGVLVLRHLLGAPVAPPAVEIPARIHEDALEALVGEYAGRELRIDVTRDGDHLYARIPGQVTVRLFPRDEERFVYRFVEATLDFERDDDGQGTALVLHQNGRDFRCERE